MSRRWEASQPGRQRAGEDRQKRPGAAAVPGHRGLYTGRYRRGRNRVGKTPQKSSEKWEMLMYPWECENVQWECLIFFWDNDPPNHGSLIGIMGI